MSASELVLADPRLETAPDLAVLGSSTQAPRATTDQSFRGAARKPSAPGEWENGQVMDLGSGLGGAAIRDALRGYVNVQRGSPGTEGTGERRRGPQGETLGLAGVDIGPAANEWIQETVQNILSSALRLEVNDKGQAAFSLFGLGEFGVSVSGDRSEIALTTGDTVLLTAQRAPGPGGPGSGGGYAGSDWQSGGFAGTSTGSGSVPIGESPFRQVMELIVELASHPLSFLAYGLIAVYGLMWAVLSRRNAAPVGRYHPALATRPRRRTAAQPVEVRSKPPGARKGRHRSRRPSTHRA